MTKKIFVCALEPSSNLHLKNLLKHLPNASLQNQNLQNTQNATLDNHENPQKALQKITYKITGVCDSDLGDTIFSPDDFSIMGFIDVFKKIFFFKKALKILSLESLKCDYILLMDSSSFNIRLAKLIRKVNKDIPIMYYILPQVWAWKAWRAKVIESLCDKLACIWKFELEYYKSKARYVGHPLLDIYKDSENIWDARSLTLDKQVQGLSSDSKIAHKIFTTPKIFTFMPGSRASEIKKLMPEFRVLIDSINNNYSPLKLRIIVPTKFKNTKKMQLYGDLSMFEIFYSTKDGLKGSHFAFICAGTATLEAALMCTPFILAYKARWLDYLIAKAFVRLKFVGLANIIYQAMLNQNDKNLKKDKGKKAGFRDEFLHQELLQGQCRATKMLECYQSFEYEKYFSGAKKLREYLGHGSAQNVARWLLDSKS